MSDMTQSALHRTEAWRALFDPATDAATLAAIAQAHPEFAATVGQHPNAYPELRAWVAERSNAVPVEIPATAAPTPVVVGADRPMSSTVLSRILWIVVFAAVTLPPVLVSLGTAMWGSWSYDDLRVLQIVLSALPAVLGVVVAAVTAPTVARKAGAVVLALGAAGCEILSSWWFDPYEGSVGLGLMLSLLALVLFFLAWAVAWPLRGAGYAAVAVLVLLSIAARAVPFVALFGGPVTFLALANVVVPALAIVLALVWSRASERRRVRQAAGGALAANSSGVGHGYPAVVATNTMAVLSLVFAFVFSLLGVIFGHVALAQIRHTGERGRGLAVAGLVIGYVAVASAIAIVVFYIVIFSTALSTSSSFR